MKQARYETYYRRACRRLALIFRSKDFKQTFPLHIDKTSEHGKFIGTLVTLFRRTDVKVDSNEN